ncbi:MAG: ATP-binding protein [Myxococcota bacterium]
MDLSPSFGLGVTAALFVAALAVGILLRRRSLTRAAALRAAVTALRLEAEERRGAQEKLAALNAELEARVAERTRELERTNRDLQHFASAASHDLQEPLRVVASYAELVDELYRDVLDAQGLRFLRHMRDASARMQQLVQDLLELARAREEMTPLVDSDADAALDDALRPLGGVLGDAALRRDPLPGVRAPAGTLPFVFQNVLANAAKYGRGADGTLALHVHAARDADGFVRIFVDDRGAGVPAEDRERIFEPFVRLHTRDEAEGTGIGLAILVRHVERAGGAVGVTEAPGGGARFWFTLPAA